MSDRLMKGLATSRGEIERGLEEAQAELAGVRTTCRDLEEMIALARVTLLASKMSGAPAPVASPSPAPAPPAPAPRPALTPPKTKHGAAPESAERTESAESAGSLPTLAERAAAIREALDPQP